jgi:hypothetical protein
MYVRSIYMGVVCVVAWFKVDALQQNMQPYWEFSLLHCHSRHVIRQFLCLFSLPPNDFIPCSVSITCNDHLILPVRREMALVCSYRFHPFYLRLNLRPLSHSFSLSLKPDDLLLVSATSPQACWCLPPET